MYNYFLKVCDGKYYTALFVAELEYRPLLILIVANVIFGCLLRAVFVVFKTTELSIVITLSTVVQHCIYGDTSFLWTFFIFPN